MRNLIIYLSALGTLSPTLAISHGAAQLRDLLAYPKYDVQFLNDLPLSHSDADRAERLGVETENEWLDLRLFTPDRRRLGDGNQVEAAEVGYMSGQK
jgi:protein OS-9